MAEACGFYVASTDPSRCKMCSLRFVDHHKAVRQCWFRSNSDSVLEAMELRQQYLKQTTPEPCTMWRELKFDDNITLCECGRLELEHNLGVQVKAKMTRKQEAGLPFIPGQYSRATGQCGANRPIEGSSHHFFCQKADGHGKRGDPVHEHKGDRVKVAWMGVEGVGVSSTQISGTCCTAFSPLVDLPGRCKWCGNRYIDHYEAARGTQLEDLTHLHAPNCASIASIRKVCNCLTDVSKQMLLDTLKSKSPNLAKPCQQFAPRFSGDFWCECGEKFYNHTKDACNGIDLWSIWRATHMSNDEIIKWFIGLGPDEITRIREFKRHLEAPSDIDPYAPTVQMINEMVNLLPLGLRNLLHVTESTLGKAMERKLLPPSPLVDSLEEKRDTCFHCGAALLEREHSLCSECVVESQGKMPQEWRPKTKPTLVKRNHTEPNINAEGEWANDGGGNFD